MLNGLFVLRLLQKHWGCCRQHCLSQIHDLGLASGSCWIKSTPLSQTSAVPAPQNFRKCRAQRFGYPISRLYRSLHWSLGVTSTVKQCTGARRQIVLSSFSLDDSGMGNEQILGWAERSTTSPFNSHHEIKAQYANSFE